MSIGIRFISQNDGKQFLKKTRVVLSKDTQCFMYEKENQFLSVLAKLRIATVRFIMSVCPSGSHWTDFHEMFLRE